MTHQPPGPTEVRRDLLWLGIGSGALFLLYLGARDLWNPNEPLYAQAVVEMARAGEWLVPTVNGEVFNEKPILYFWLARIAAGLFGGVNEFSVRVPSAVAGLLSVIWLYLLVKPYSDRVRACTASALLATTYLVFWSARSVQMDMLLGALVLGGVLAATRALDHGGSPWRAWPLVGLAAGAGVLAKGPVALICLGLILLTFIVSSRNRRAFHPAMIAGGIVCLLTAAPWFLMLWFRGEGEFLSEMLFRQNVTRFTDPWDHQSPWWYYLVHFWADMLPWSLFVPLSFALPGRDADERKLDRLAWGWILVLVLFFSLSMSKRSPYLLPCAPAVAILVSGLATRLRHGGLGRFRRRASMLLLGFWGVLLFAGGLYLVTSGLDRIPEIESVGRAVGVLLLSGGLSLLVTSAMPSLREQAPAALFAFVVSFYLLASIWALPAVNLYKSPRLFCHAVNEAVSSGPLRSYGMWKWRAGYVYYTGRTIPRLADADALERYWGSDERVFLIVERGKREDVERILGPMQPVVAQPIGSNYAFLFSNQPPE